MCSLRTDGNHCGGACLTAACSGRGTLHFLDGCRIDVDSSVVYAVGDLYVPGDSPECYWDWSRVAVSCIVGGLEDVVDVS